jgi:hypothetical protein
MRSKHDKKFPPKSLVNKITQCHSLVEKLQMARPVAIFLAFMRSLGPLRVCKSPTLDSIDAIINSS